MSKGLRSNDNKRRPETPYAALRIKKRRKLLPLDGVGISFDCATVEKRIDEDDPLSSELMLVVGDAAATVGEVAAATGLSVRHLSDINRRLHSDLDRFSEARRSRTGPTKPSCSSPTSSQTTRARPRPAWPRRKLPACRLPLVGGGGSV